MKQFLKAHFGTIVIVLFSIAIIASVSVHKSYLQKEKQKQEMITQQSKLNSYKVHLNDSVKSELMAMQLKEIDSIKRIESEKTKVADMAAQYHAKEVNKLRAKNKALSGRLDSLIIQGTAPCSEMLEACIESNTGLRSEIKELDSLAENLNSEAQGYSSQLYLCEKENRLKDSAISDKNKSIEILQLELSRLQCLRDYSKLNFFQKIFAKKCK